MLALIVREENFVSRLNLLGCHHDVVLASLMATLGIEPVPVAMIVHVVERRQGIVIPATDELHGDLNMVGIVTSLALFLPIFGNPCRGAFGWKC